MLQQWGGFNFCLFLLNKLLVKASGGSCRMYRYYFTAQPVAKAALTPQGKGGKIEIRLIDEHDEIVRQFPRPAAAIQARFEQGALCLGASKDAHFIGFLWLVLGNKYYHEDEVRARYITLPTEQTAWDFDVYVAPDFRLGRTFSRLWGEANRILAENGVLWSCSRISAFNSGSLRAHAHLGAVSLGSAIFFYAGRWQLTFASISPYFHFSSHADSFPEFRLHTEGLRATCSPPQDKSTME
ncbi:GNAT family N-acetyltransferase [Nitrosovibrio sp. Nv6]|uniref:GNAT family N-acetyltransferase n=1 Tax=Nitrosovibrio sp. Nv6 TaxID=1855340 RepID=UPI0008B30ABE|nr:hypothetical protein [Nitrosovibrio sp. Nv6]SEP35979.1 hypothetical protein SAMN05216316_2590 [Nitrosovibrio sp. Nv6]